MRKLYVLVVDDERLAIFNLAWTLNLIDGVGDVQWFLTAEEALEWLASHDVDVAFLDIEMRDMNGLELAERIQRIHPSIAIIFLTGYSEYAVDAFKIKAYGYLLKPASKADVEREISGLLAKVRESPAAALEAASSHGWLLKAQTFGDFEAFSSDGKPLHFVRQKSKETLAFLIDRRGAGVTSADLAAIILPGRPYDRSNQKYMQTVISDMTKTLRSVGAEEAIVRFRNHLAVDVSRIDCDYYRLLAGDEEARRSFTGEYLTNYAWAGETATSLRNKVAR